MNKLSTVLLQGIEREVKVMRYPGKNTQIYFREGSFTIYINKNLTIDAGDNEARSALKLWLRNQARMIIEEQVKKYSEIIGVSCNNIRIKDTKSRWGSCSSKGNLNFSWRIVMAPRAVMDYIIIHELCHLKHMNHSKEYWATVAQYMPDYSRHKTWLRINGAKLGV